MVAAVTVRKDGKAEHAFVGEVGWHGLGNQLQDGAPIETWIKEAGMDWSINRGPLTFTNAANKPVIINGQKALHRSDNDGLLGIVSDTYKVVQPAEVLEFFRDLCDNNGFALNTAGTRYSRRRGSGSRASSAAIRVFSASSRWAESFSFWASSCWLTRSFWALASDEIAETSILGSRIWRRSATAPPTP